VPEGLGGAEVGLYETLMTSASAYALGLHADRIARSWERLTGRPFARENVPSLRDARAQAIRQQWPGLRFEVRRFADGSTVAQIRRRDKPSVHPPVRLLPVEFDTPDAAYPHKSVDRQQLMLAYQRAVAAGADDALFVVGGEVRETAQAFVGLVTVEALVLPPLGEDVLPSTTRTAVADWCRENGRAVIERPIRMDELDRGTLIYGNALVGLLPAVLVGRPAAPLPAWFSAPGIERRLAG
jgi:branched-subunit amino acid aminotransferase/4-amino-4-deoxychorismate lyase